MSKTNKRKPGNKATRRAAYLKLRTEHPTLPASSLFRWTLETVAKAKRKDPLEWRHDDTGRGKVQGFDVVVRARPEDDYSLEDVGLGRFLYGHEHKGDLRRKGAASGEMTHYRPLQSLGERIRYRRVQMGMARHDAWLSAREEEKRELALAEEYASGDRCPFYVSVKVYRNGLELGSSGIGMCDGDGDYLKQTVIEHGLIEEAIAEAREALAGLCGRRCKSKKGA